MRSRDNGYEFGVGAVGLDDVDRLDGTSRIRSLGSLVRSTIHMQDVVWSLYPWRTTLSIILTFSLSMLIVVMHAVSHKRDHEVVSSLHGGSIEV